MPDTNEATELTHDELTLLPEQLKEVLKLEKQLFFFRYSLLGKQLTTSQRTIRERLNFLMSAYGDKTEYQEFSSLHLYTTDWKKEGPEVNISCSLSARHPSYEELIDFPRDVGSLQANYDCSNIEYLEGVETGTNIWYAPEKCFIWLNLKVHLLISATIPKEEQDTLIALGKIKITYNSSRSATCSF